MEPLSPPPDFTNRFPLPTQEDFAGLAKLGDRIQSLTSRQKAVIAWLARGRSNSEIVEVLGVSRNTVEREITLIFDELGVENRIAASAIYLQWVLSSEPLRKTPDE